MLLLSAELSAPGLQQGYGWLDRMVQFQKNKFFREVNELAPINMNVELRAKSAGYEDSRHWDYNSVLRLLSLIRASETAKPVHNALRRMLQPTRRIMMSMKQSMKRFPSIKNDNNNLYYDVDYTSAEEDAAPPGPAVPEEQAVIIVSNPVEARLPSAQISVKLLREILEARARAARQMPTTAAVIPWVEFLKNRTTSKGTTATKESPASTHEDSKTTTSVKPGSTGGADRVSTPAGSSPDTSITPAGPPGTTPAGPPGTTPAGPPGTTPAGPPGTTPAGPPGTTPGTTSTTSTTTTTTTSPRI